MVKNQTAYDGGQSQSSAETDSSSGGWKYMTVKEGGRVYTYLVIGKNMRVLIGESSEETDNKDKKSADGKDNAAGGAEQANTSAGNDFSGSADSFAINGQKEKNGVKTDFLMDTSMFALTGYYQEKMRETIKQLSNSIGDGSKGAVTVDIEEQAGK
ncbi:hypothetical protein P22_2767 [Propionispora sp. 2/2-37]|uniref:hypothetical protein n=1 Tax=Propionispora sp. 2/2-37 TaxID=1677858 RepID=UPI0006C35657|nr:hypothetical protein [Propionispora sp. 2/2-37]CUH96677.1 hypothetical protein P22_2767 [Propionispora sp. 2/2-37]